MKKMIMLAMLMASTTSTMIYAQASDIIGLWRSMDDKTGFSNGLVRVQQDKDGTYSGTVEKIFDRPNRETRTICQQCPAPFKDQPILGMKVIWGLSPDRQDENTYIGGYIIDPATGKIYRNKLRLSKDGRRLTNRGYVGVSMVGRSQVWLRESEK